MPWLPTHLVQELNIGTVLLERLRKAFQTLNQFKTRFSNSYQTPCKCKYRILPINRTVLVEVGKIFCGRDVGNLPFYTMIADRRVLAVIAPLSSHCSVCLEVCGM